MYKVLWIDDQYKDAEMIQFAIEADNEGLLLEGYPSFEEGFEALENNLVQYDVILLDGLFFEKKGQELGTEDESGIGMAIAKLNELKNKKVFPWFVLSGKDKFTKGENSLLRANKANCFDKTNPSDVVRLFAEMKIAASQQGDAQLKHKYHELLEVCSDAGIGSDHLYIPVENRTIFQLKTIPFLDAYLHSFCTNERRIKDDQNEYEAEDYSVQVPGRLYGAQDST